MVYFALHHFMPSAAWQQHRDPYALASRSPPILLLRQLARQPTGANLCSCSKGRQLSGSATHSFGPQAGNREHFFWRALRTLSFRTRCWDLAGPVHCNAEFEQTARSEADHTVAGRLAHIGVPAFENEGSGLTIVLEFDFEARIPPSAPVF